MTEVPAESRRGIIVVTRSQRDILRRDDQGIDIIEDPEILTLTFDPREDGGIVDNLRRHGLYRVGQVAIQSPYDAHIYSAPENALENFAREKALTFITLAKMLGARTVTVSNVQLVEAGQKTHVDGEVGLAAGALGATASSRLEERIESSLKGEHLFTGGDADFGAAEELMTRAALWGDPTFRHLVDLRRGHNSLRRHEVVINGTHEATKNLDIGVRVSAPMSKLRLAGLSGDFKQEVSHRYQVEIKSVVEFD